MTQLTKEEQETWDSLNSKEFFFPDKNATLRITQRCGEVGSVYLDPASGDMFVYDGKNWHKMK
jgi:hypothetical protein